MHALIPVSSLYSNRKRLMPLKLLTEHEVVRAHIGAPDWLAEASSVQRVFWRRRAFDLLLTGIVPIAGYCLGWPLLWILVALAVDVAGHWLADALRLYLRPQALTDEIAHALEGERTLATIKSLREPVTLEDQRRQCWVPDDFRMHHGPFFLRMQHLLWLFLCVVLPGAVLAIAATNHMTKQFQEFAAATPLSLSLLALPLLLRPLAVMIDMRRANRGATDVSWLPETPLHGLNFVLAGEVPLLLTLLTDDFKVLRYWGESWPQVFVAWVFLLSFLAINALIAGLWFARHKRHALLLRGFGASDRGELKRRWATYNGSRSPEA